WFSHLQRYATYIFRPVLDHLNCGSLSIRGGRCGTPRQRQSGGNPMDMKKREFLTAGLGVVGGMAAAGAVMAQNAPPAGRGAAAPAGRGPGFGRGGPPPIFTGVQPS